MSSGYKHLYSCVTFILFMVVVNFYKNKIHQAREREAFVRTKTRGNIPVKHSMQLMKHRPVAMFEDEEDDDSWFSGGKGVGRTNDGHEMTYRESVLERMKEFPDECKDMEVFCFTKERVDGEQTGAKGYEPPVGGPQQKTTTNNTRQQDTSQNSSVYVFLSVLIILLIAAGVDIAKHIRANPRQDNIRRLSLQNYQALIREKQKQFRMMKQHYSQPSMSISRSIDESNFPLPPPCLTANFTTRTKEDLESHDSKAPPLLQRRQSVPALMRPSSSLLSKNGSTYSRQMCRRPSVDSYGGFGGGAEREVVDLASFNTNKAPNGSPTEMRRRVRMLHRH
ncbi:uncharacterized protein LOC135705301 [Ochlerotatus camptorhynchus]|uniref:uncharacterized protein LOC135705301 n=1 Tax=Ochlerotatus camptorhynchus TaxID=644619 RepID=UPI0031D8B215